MKNLPEAIETKSHIPAKRSSYRNSNRLILVMMALPMVILMIVLNYIPLFGWIYAFFDYHPGVGLANSPFVGLKYFKMALDFSAGSELLQVIRNTLVLSLIGFILTPLPMLFAVFLSEMRIVFVKKFVQVTTTIPYFLSWILVFGLAFATFSVDDGFVNQLLVKWNMHPINPLANDSIAWYFQSAIGLWKNLGFNAIIYLAAMGSIDQQLYDSARVDGAGRFQRIWHVTVPGLMPTFIVLLLLNISFFLDNGFEQYYAFLNPLVQNKIQVFDYYIYRTGLALGEYSYSTTLGMFKTIVSVILLFSANWVTKRIRGDSIL